MTAQLSTARCALPELRARRRRRNKLLAAASSARSSSARGCRGPLGKDEAQLTRSQAAGSRHGLLTSPPSNSKKPRGPGRLKEPGRELRPGTASQKQQRRSAAAAALRTQRPWAATAPRADWPEPPHGSPPLPFPSYLRRPAHPAARCRLEDSAVNQALFVPASPPSGLEGGASTILSLHWPLGAVNHPAATAAPRAPSRPVGAFPSFLSASLRLSRVAELLAGRGGAAGGSMTAEARGAPGGG